MPDNSSDADRLPKFKYHPDPIATGSVIDSTQECTACHLRRGWIYNGPVYGQDVGALCPWCIADGTAHRLFGIEFVDPAGVGGYGDWDTVPQQVLEEICFRTPSFRGWQQERWFTHCQDAAEFLGPVGAAELTSFAPEARAAIAEECGLAGQTLETYMARLDKRYGPTAYIFRCRICGSWGGYSDIH